MYHFPHTYPGARKKKEGARACAGGGVGHHLKETFHVINSERQEDKEKNSENNHREKRMNKIKKIKRIRRSNYKLKRKK